MVPLTLYIKNFLSYGNSIQTIDFGEHQLICLSGKNGHGKSALLEAITWALWGQARKASGVSRADGHLLRLGQTHMMVMLDFKLSDSRYRVKREYMFRGNKPYLTLEFGMFDPHSDKLLPFTDKTIKTTQAKIEHTLRLSFDAFVNSAFLRQGNANEFSKRTPKERKQIISSILGIDQYEAIRKLALERARDAASNEQTVCAFKDKAEEELKQSATVKEHLKKVQGKLKDVEIEEKKLAEIEQKSATQRSALAEQERERDLLTIEQQKGTQEEQSLLQELRTQMNNWRTTHRTHLASAQHIADPAHEQKVITALSAHQTTLQKNLELKEQILKTKNSLQLHAQTLKEAHSKIVQTKQITHERLGGDLRALEQSIAELSTRQKAQQQELTQQQTVTQQSETREKELATLLGEYETRRAQFDKRRDFYQRLATQEEWISNEHSSLDQKSQLVRGTQQPCCPLCEQNLSASRKLFLANKFSTKRIRLAQQQKRISGILARLKQLLIEQREIVRTDEKHRQELATIKTQQTQYQQAHTQLQKALTEYETHIAQRTAQQKKLTHEEQQLRTEITSLTQKEHTLLEADETYRTLHGTLKKQECELAALPYDARAHQETQTQLEAIRRMRTQHEQIRSEIAQQSQRADGISKLCNTIKGIRTKLKKFSTQLFAYQTLDAKRKSVEEEQARHAQQRTVLAKQKETLLEERGKLDEQCTKLEKLRTECEGYAKKIKDLHLTCYDYQAIATATGKDGIQALLIEEAIPEIEREANTLLARLTDNQAQLFIESLRDLKKGGTRETLDIKISDSAGIRPYELFSGGEAFRIDFALRIAISKLLARRAGTTLQTLIIDEGFGSQDEDGLAHIMDAVYSIREDFSKVIIVSHLASMKDQFPVHFVVEKDSTGSHVQVIEHG